MGEGGDVYCGDGLVYCVLELFELMPTKTRMPITAADTQNTVKVLFARRYSVCGFVACGADGVGLGASGFGVGASARCAGTGFGALGIELTSDVSPAKPTGSCWCAVVSIKSRSVAFLLGRREQERTPSL